MFHHRRPHRDPEAGCHGEASQLWNALRGAILLTNYCRRAPLRWSHFPPIEHDMTVRWAEAGADDDGNGDDDYCDGDQNCNG